MKGGVSSVAFGMQSVSLAVALQCHCAWFMIIDHSSAAGSHKARVHGPGAWRTQVL